jgi:hypothetical protein
MCSSKFGNMVKKNGHSENASDNTYFIPTVNLVGQLAQPGLYS